MKSLPNLKYKHLAIALGLGAISTLLASWGELGLMSDTAPLLQPFENGDMTPSAILTAVLIAPFVEELAKPIGLYFMQAEEKPKLGLKEWAFLGAMAGLGFAIVENFMYAGYIGSYGTGTEGAALLMLLRFMLPLHMMASAISGYGFGLWVKTRNVNYFVYCLLAAMILHGLFNLAATLVG